MKSLLKYLPILLIFLCGCFSNKTSYKTVIGKDKIAINYTDSETPNSRFHGKATDIKKEININGAIVELTRKKANERIKDTTNLEDFAESLSEHSHGVYIDTTDQEGSFSFENIPAGDYTLYIYFKKYRSVFLDIIKIKSHSNCLAKIELLLSKPSVREKNDIPFQMITAKPVIYIYPKQVQKINAKLDFKGILTHTYPKYPEHGWQIIAEPNGTLWDENKQEYYALFWEGLPYRQIIPNDGFVISGKGTTQFLEEKLAYLGLNRREANEFIMYWLPRMENNPYNLIHFSGKQYEEQAVLEIEPKPETIIRVMMITKPLESKIQLPVQDLSPLHKIRKGYTVVEWGGTSIQTKIEDL